MLMLIVSLVLAAECTPIRQGNTWIIPDCSQDKVPAELLLLPVEVAKRYPDPFCESYPAAGPVPAGLPNVRDRMRVAPGAYNGGARDGGDGYRRWLESETRSLEWDFELRSYLLFIETCSAGGPSATVPGE